MDTDFASRVQARTPQRGKGSRTRILLGAMLAAFLVGAALAAYLVASGVFASVSDDVARMVGNDTEARRLLDAPATGPAVEAMSEQQGGLESRLAAMEQRLTRLDLQSQASAGNAARAEGLLIAFSARRAIERGEPLGYLEQQLSLRFGAAEPGAVRDVIAAAKEPITTELLMARLDALSPRLAREAEEGVSWSWFQRELGELFIVRKESSPSPLPEDRLQRARLRLEAGMIDSAIGEVRNLPGAPVARAWVVDAQRHSKALKALDRIERAAILEPRQLRDSGGNSVEQPSPATPVVTGTAP